MGKIAIWGQFMYSVSLITQLNKELGEPEVEKYIEKVRQRRCLPSSSLRDRLIVARPSHGRVDAMA